MSRSRNTIALVGIFVSTWCGSAVLGADFVVNRFDAASEATEWNKDWGGVTSWLISFDPSMDAGGSTTQGSLKVEVDYSNAITCAAGCNNFTLTKALAATIDLTNYASVDMDIWIDPSSPKRGTGTDHGYFGVATRDGDNWATNFEGGRGLQPDGQWVHFSMPVTGFPNGPHNSVRALTMQNWGNDTGSELNGHWIVWIDNVVFVPKPPPPGATVIVNDFNSADEITAWLHGHDPANINESGATPTVTAEWDPAVDSDGPAGSGAMKLTIVWNHGVDASEEVQITRDMGGSIPADLRDYTSFTARVRVDPNGTNPVNVNNQSGCDAFVFRLTGAPWWVGMSGCTALVSSQNGGWNTLDVSLPSATNPQRDIVGGLTMQLGAWGDYWGMTGTLVIWLDHITFGRQLPCASGLCEVCGNGADDNNNGLVDCNDPDCHGGNQCPLETACSDHADNNGNGLADCADPDCAQDPNCKVNTAWADSDGDGDVDQTDFADIQQCFTAMTVLSSPGCGKFDRDNNGYVDLTDMGKFIACASLSGPEIPIASCQ